MSYPPNFTDPVELAKQLARSRAEFIKMIDELIQLILNPDVDIDQKYQALYKVCTKDRKLYTVNESLFKMLDNEVKLQRIYKKKNMITRLKMSQERSDRIIRLILKRAYPNLLNRTTILLGEEEAEGVNPLAEMEL